MGQVAFAWSVACVSSGYTKPFGELPEIVTVAVLAKSRKGVRYRFSVLYSIRQRKEFQPPLIRKNESDQLKRYRTPFPCSPFPGFRPNRRKSSGQDDNRWDL